MSWVYAQHGRQVKAIQRSRLYESQLAQDRRPPSPLHRIIVEAPRRGKLKYLAVPGGAQAGYGLPSLLVVAVTDEGLCEEALHSVRVHEKGLSPADGGFRWRE